MALGTVLLIKADLGLSAFDALCIGLSNNISLTTGNWCMILGVIIILINAYMEKVKPSLFSFLTSILVGVFIDFWMNIIQININFITTKIIVFAAGIILNTFGIALYISAELVKGPIDQLMLNISNILKKNMSWGKTIMESIFFVLVIVFKGPIGVGTIIVTFLSGFFVNYFYNLMRGIIWRTLKNA